MATRRKESKGSVPRPRENSFRVALPPVCFSKSVTTARVHRNLKYEIKSHGAIPDSFVFADLPREERLPLFPKKNSLPR